MSETTNQNSNTKNRNKILSIVYIGVSAALIAICSWIQIPLTVPITLQTMGVCLISGLLGFKRGTLATLVYILLGAIGVPVFAGFSGGLAVILGSTGGYIIGFLPMAIVIGLGLKGTLKLAKKSVILSVIASILLMEAATWIPYLLGTAWLAYSMKMTFIQALSAGVIPFIIEDLIKMVIVAIVGPTLRKTLAPYSGVQYGEN